MPAAATTATKIRKSGEPFYRLEKLAKNLWWSWNPDASNLFASLDPALFAATNQNPIRTLNLLTPERRNAVKQNMSFATHLERVEESLEDYLAAPTWFEKTQKSAGKPLVAYFCSEFAVHESLPQYSGGLGVLAGDHVKSASDLGVPLVGVGLLYRAGYYTQEFNPDGTTRVIYPELNFDELPITFTGTIIDVPLAGRTIKAKIWKQVVGRTVLYLLDTDHHANKPADRKLTHHLYGGDREYRIKQEILLGVGGLRALRALKLPATVYHMNEGHAAFAALERVRERIDAGESYAQAVQNVRNSSVFTTHTPVPAGNDRFEPKLALKYIGAYALDLGLSKDELLWLGRENPADKSEEFCMTVLALKLSRNCNGVAALHGEVSRQMWVNVFHATKPQEVPIGSITNGIHSETWLAPEARPLYDRYLKPRWIGASNEPGWWDNADKIPAGELWNLRKILRTKMIQFIRTRLTQQAHRHGGAPADLIAAATALDENALTIGFARRFATYKRAPLIFRDIKRLAKILSAEGQPVQLVFAGKAHPKDQGGQDFAKKIYELSHGTFAGRVVLLEDYDMQVGRLLTSGCDVWLNNPLRPQEASGTSGMKPPLHGGINCSILDGWWPEAFDKTNGWAIGDGTQLADLEKQNRSDANAIYSILESSMVPLFYERDKVGIPQKWVTMMKHSMKTVCAAYSTHRMVGEYWTKYYSAAHNAT